MSNISTNIPKEGDKSNVASTNEILIVGTDYNKAPSSLTIDRQNEIDFTGNTVNPKEFTEKFSVDLFDRESARDQLFRLHEGNFIEPWKLVEDLSARLIDQYDETVVVECLVDRDAKVYIESEMDKMLFDGYNLEVGSLFKISKYTRKNEVRFVVRAKPQLVSEDDFPKVDFQQKYGGDIFNPE